MSSKLFLFTKAEISQIKNPKTNKIGLTGDTWEEAMRFMIKKNLSNLSQKLDEEKNVIGYLVNWLEKQEQGVVKEWLPADILSSINNIELDDAFIEEWIKESRKFFREN